MGEVMEDDFMAKETTVDSKFVQQHLANERTFLAWVRTSITITGLGFLAAGVVFRSMTLQNVGHLAAVIVGISAVVLGSLISFMACRNYMRKRVAINEETFLATTDLVYFMVCCLTLINLFLVILVVILLLE